MEKKIKILVALKLIENADDLMKRTIRVVNWSNAHIFLLHVLKEMPTFAFHYDVYKLWEDFRDKAMKETLKSMNVYIEKLSKEFNDVEAMVAVGDPDKSILEEAERLDVDLIIIGKCALTGIKQLIHDNVAEKVVKNARRPVLSFPVGDGDNR